MDSTLITADDPFSPYDAHRCISQNGLRGEFPGFLANMPFHTDLLTETAYRGNSHALERRTKPPEISFPKISDTCLGANRTRRRPSRLGVGAKSTITARIVQPTTAATTTDQPMRYTSHALRAAATNGCLSTMAPSLTARSQRIPVFHACWPCPTLSNALDACPFRKG